MGIITVEQELFGFSVFAPVTLSDVVNMCSSSLVSIRDTDSVVFWIVTYLPSMLLVQGMPALRPGGKTPL